MKSIQILIPLAVAVLAAGCAPVVPNALLNARSAYQLASTGPAAQRVPAEVHKARQALLLAEVSFRSEKDTFRTRDLAYVAQRKAELANILSNTSVDKENTVNAKGEYNDKMGEMVAQSKEDARNADMTAMANANDANMKAVQAANDLAAQKAAADLAASEERTATALDELAKATAAKEEERGLVITLSGSVLFRSNQSELLPSAKEKLDQVSSALQSVRERHIVVEGHTDSQGSDAYNQSLSQRRADAVRTYLIQGGFPSDLIQAQGKGKGSPIADNGSAEGRANNRRVEIVIQRAALNATR